MATGSVSLEKPDKYIISWEKASLKILSLFRSTGLVRGKQRECLP